MAIITTETRLDMKNSPDIIEYVRQYRTDYGIIQRYVWYQIVQSKSKINKSQLNTDIQKKFGVTKRTANSIIYDMKGRYKALKELKKTELFQISNKIEVLENKIERFRVLVDNLSKKAAKNELSESRLKYYRGKKKSLFYEKQRLQKLKDKHSQLEKDIVEGKYRIGFGCKRVFNNQYRLSENGFKTHEGWYNDFVKRRDRNIFYLGSKDESGGNQMFQLTSNQDGSFAIQIRKDGKYSNPDKYVYGKCKFSYMSDQIKDILNNRDRAISFRIKFRGTKVYLQAIFTLDTSKIPVVTRSSYGCIGLDFNDGHIELSETDDKGNLVGIKTYPLKFHGTGGKAENEMRTIISEIGKYAASVGKDIVKEDLSFVKKKSKTSKAKTKHGKDYNRMLHTLDYARYEDALKNMVARYGIRLIKVNPAYTSKIAKQKYCNQKKISVHSGAAYVIARRGQGYIDNYFVK